MGKDQTQLEAAYHAPWSTGYINNQLGLGEGRPFVVIANFRGIYTPTQDNFKLKPNSDHRVGKRGTESTFCEQV